jgi:hypothetical protein
VTATISPNSPPGTATNYQNTQHATLTRRRIYAEAKLVFAAGAIAAGATALAPAAQASPTHIPAAQFKQDCINWPFLPGSTQHVEYKEFRVSNDLHQICNILDGNAILQSDSNVVVGYFSLKLGPGPQQRSPVAS